MQQSGLATSSLQLQVLEAEVPTELLVQLETLDKTLKENKRMHAEIRDIRPADELTALETKITKLGRLIAQQKSAINQERVKGAGLAEKIGLDQRVVQSIERAREAAASKGASGIQQQQYGRLHALDYLHEMAGLNERQLEGLWESVQRLRQMMERMQQENGDLSALSRNDLAEHIKRFDQIFETVATQVYSLADGTEKLRDSFMDQRKQLGLGTQFDPFEKAKERQRLINAYATLKGVDAFPSSNAILSMSEYLPKQPQVPAQPQFGSTPFGQQPFGTAAGTGTLFGQQQQRPAAPAFSFNLPSSTVGQRMPGAAPGGTSLFGTPQPAVSTPLFGGGAPIRQPGPAPSLSLFGTPTTTTAAAAAPSLSLFGSAAPQQPQSATPSSSATSIQQQPAAPTPPFGFSNTLSSASSGTLFKGSAQPAQQQQPLSRPPLFGGLSNKRQHFNGNGGGGGGTFGLL